MYYKSEKIKSVLPTKLELSGKVIFNPKWHHYEAAGWNIFPSNLKLVDRKYIKWIDGDPVEMTQEEKEAVDQSDFDQRKQALLNTVYQNYEQAEIANITPAGAVTLLRWVEAEVPKAIVTQDWFQTLYAERDAKLTAIESGDLTVDPTPSESVKPHSFRQIQEQINQLMGV